MFDSVPMRINILVRKVEWEKEEGGKQIREFRVVETGATLQRFAAET